MKHDLRSQLERLLRQLELDAHPSTGLSRNELHDVIFDASVELKRLIDFVLPRETAR